MNITISESENQTQIEYTQSYEMKKNSMKASPENYLNELALNSKCMERLEDFVNTLDSV